LEALSPIVEFFYSEGTAGGLIGAFLILAASYFIEIRLPLKTASWGKKILFLFAAGLVGALFHHTTDLRMELCVVLGAGWPYVAVYFQKVAMTYSAGKKLQPRVYDEGGPQPRVHDEGGPKGTPWL